MSNNDIVKVRTAFLSITGTPRSIALVLILLVVFFYVFYWIKDKHEERKVIREQKQKDTQEEEQSTPEECEPSTKSFDEMEASPMSADQGWIVDGMFPKGQISAYVAGADTGKTIAMVDIAIAASKGIVPTFLPENSQPSEKVDVVYYRLEPRPGENVKRGYTSELFPSNLSWVTLDDLTEPTQGALVCHITSYARKAKRDTLFIVDPLSKFKGDFDSGKFYSLMKALNEEAGAKGLCHTFIASVHADEKRPWQPATSEDIKGGDTLIQQWDAVVMLRKERRNSYRFIQVLKAPKGTNDSDNVIVTKFSTDGGYTHHSYDSYKRMTDALPIKPKATEIKECETTPNVDEKFTLTDVQVHEIVEMSKPRPGENRHNVSRSIQEFCKKYNVTVADGTIRNTFYARCKEMGITSHGSPRSSE